MHKVKRIVPFILVLLFAILYMVGFVPKIYNGYYGKTINIIAQVGLGVSIILFFIFKGKKKPPK